ncbi:hypothetical protein E2C01_039974 [Portunus trituberculatus]|uniref:Uncharacterized protein n=1 Tax=Portunus trituberculatus TaxID=210409 RepID=A0A5B7FF73_PORTR|nr:hypothetical protein [Portunus trituberculatus]
MAKFRLKIGELGEKIWPDLVSEIPARKGQASHVGGGAEPISAEDFAVPPQPANHARRSSAHCLLCHLHTNRPADDILY